VALKTFWNKALSGGNVQNRQSLPFAGSDLYKLNRSGDPAKPLIEPTQIPDGGCDLGWRAGIGIEEFLSGMTPHPQDCSGNSAGELSCCVYNYMGGPPVPHDHFVGTL
jgi:hypothetical protein